MAKYPSQKTHVLPLWIFGIDEASAHQKYHKIRRTEQHGKNRGGTVRMYVYLHGSLSADVYKAEYHMSKVAVKQLKSIQETHLEDFLKETLLMLYDNRRM